MKVSVAAASLGLLATFATMGGVVESLDPAKVRSSDKTQWCILQRSTCYNVCVDKGERTRDNTCNAGTLAWTCLCTNNVVPNTTEYTQTIPYFTCQYDLTSCTNDCKGLESCVNNCRKQYVCGATDPPKGNGTETNTTTTPSSTNTPNKLPNATLDDAATGLRALESIGYALVASSVIAFAAIAGF
ncbi:hypothetical protein THASP1DRAFT_29267 [Thamnocephalis sphaerospora]|uniref:DUF7707 domain-containing protein n=1 Tax=Thamnocephalis sphaerospora TaxID=78915 RepID=A0A4P9XS62_9FUNG|nr:hypothetical protein THASP1DRAFT_29267 [Thamnocephalis sphaerospora]|eukprot:RKP08945.1 hypothetical protein THASP1DRAFT_29267 [Thamnocephalis sphaerospora]